MTDTRAITVVAKTPNYELAINPVRRYLRIVLFGFWDEAAARDFGRDLSAAIGALVNGGVAFGSFRTLLDVRHSSIMAQDLISLLQSYAAKYGPSSERVALLSASVLQQMQYKRIASQAMFQYYLNEELAMDELFDP